MRGVDPALRDEPRLGPEERPNEPGSGELPDEPDEPPDAPGSDTDSDQSAESSKPQNQANPRIKQAPESSKPQNQASPRNKQKMQKTSQNKRRQNVSYGVDQKVYPNRGFPQWWNLGLDREL